MGRNPRVRTRGIIVTSYLFRIDFSTGDALYHVNSFYQINLTFAPTNLDLTWETTYSGTTGNPWVITNNGRSLRFNVENSENCGGLNANVQSGQATTTIEVEDSADTIKLQKGKVIVKDGKLSCLCCPVPFGLLARGTSDGQGLGCAMGPIVSQFLVEPPYQLSTNLTMTLSFNGVGELEATGYENISFYLDPVIP